MLLSVFTSDVLCGQVLEVMSNGEVCKREVSRRQLLKSSGEAYVHPCFL